MPDEKELTKEELLALKLRLEKQHKKITDLLREKIYKAEKK